MLEKFEVGKCYMRGEDYNCKFIVRGTLDTMRSNDTLIGELRSGSLRDLSTLLPSEWHEITKEEFMGVTELVPGKYYKNDCLLSNKYKVLVNVKTVDDCIVYAVEDANGAMSLVSYGGKASNVWHEITEEEYLTT